MSDSDGPARASPRASSVARSIRRSRQNIARVLRTALDPSTALRPRGSGNDNDDNVSDDNVSNENVSDNEADDEDVMPSWRLALFILNDNVCKAIFDAITKHPQVTFWRLWHMDHWWKRSWKYEFAENIWPSWRSCFYWPFTTLRKIGFLGLYKGFQWHVLANLASNIVNWALAWCPKFLNVRLSEKTRQRITAGCAVVPHMYCQVCL